MKIYTRTGDRGQTALFGGGRVEKNHARIAACGDVDELNSTIGVAGACEPDVEPELLASIQQDLFAIGALLSSPHPNKVSDTLQKAAVSPDRVRRLEAAIDVATAELAPRSAFVLPGGAPKAAAFHVARTVCRRAERSVVALSLNTDVPPVILAYLNRLSDLLFVFARLANHRANVPDRIW